MRNLYPKIETTTDYRRLLSRADVDAVVVATPPETHHRLAVEALRAGKHVFVEKPLALSSAEGAEMVEE
jgi:predicted dehydrogenase